MSLPKQQKKDFKKRFQGATLLGNHTAEPVHVWHTYLSDFLLVKNGERSQN